MPEIAAIAVPAAPVASASPTPAAPAAAPGAAGGPQEGLIQVQGGVGASDTPATSFLSQLKVALAGLSHGPAKPPAPTVTTVNDAAQPAEASSPVEPHAQTDDAAAATNPPTADDAMAELLAALGLVPVPPTLTPAVLAGQPQATVPSMAGQASAAQPSLPGMAQAPTAQAAPAQAPATDAPLASALAPAMAAGSAPAQAAPAPAAVHGPTSSAPLSMPAAAATAPASDLQAALAQIAATTPGAPQPTDAAPSPAPALHTPQPNGVAQLQAAQTAPAPVSDATAVAAANVAAAQVLPQPPASHAAPTPGAPTASAAPVPPTTMAADPSLQSAHTDTDTQHSGHSAQDAPSPAQQPGAADPSTVNQAFVPPAATVDVTTSATAANVHPSEIVSQIAQQADLYRLPGNKGLRIQLHPEDLGGVEVTVKYSATGGIELHVTTEHAETGSLVQAGWSQLRDALATHGISPERVVVSVAAPSSASGSDLSGGNPGGRSGAGQAAFNFAQGQHQSGRQREGADPRSGANWGRPFPSSLPQVAPTTGVGVASTSRIDYRA